MARLRRLLSVEESGQCAGDHIAIPVLHYTSTGRQSSGPSRVHALHVISG